MTPDRARWLLEHPLDRVDPEGPPADVLHHLPQVDGAILTATLAVDR